MGTVFNQTIILSKSVGYSLAINRQDCSSTLGCFILGVMFEVNKTQPLVGPNGLKMKYGMGLTPRGMPKTLLGPKNTCELAETENEV